MTQVRLFQGKYCKRTGKRLQYVCLDPQPQEKDLLKLGVYYTTLKHKPSYKRKITKLHFHFQTKMKINEQKISTLYMNMLVNILGIYVMETLKQTIPFTFGLTLIYLNKLKKEFNKMFLQNRYTPKCKMNTIFLRAHEL